MIEVEVKAKINSFDEIKDKLNDLGAIKVKTETKTEESHNLFITYKGPKIDSKSKTREEVEMKIEDAEKCSRIFENLGFKEVRTVIKDREYYSLENFEISLDNVWELDPYMEIELALEDGSDYSEAQKSIFDIFERLGITEGFERTSYLELLENLDNEN